MKRIGNLFDKVTDFNNLRQAEKNARKGKSHQPGVKLFNQNPDGFLLLLQESLINQTFTTSQYETFSIYEPKERLIFKLPYYPDRIVHHAIINVLKPYFHSWFTADTYANIEGRGIHSGLRKLKKALKDEEATKYCLKLDIKKYYPNIDHDLLKVMLRRKIKDHSLLKLIDGIIDSADGLPIGNYLSQYLSNFYLSYFDRYIKQDLKAKHYFRYLDDIVILAPTKEELHFILSQIRIYFRDHLKLEIKSNYQVFPVKSRGIDFLGYVSFHTHIRIRKRIKKGMVKAALKKKRNRASIASYLGWANHANTINLKRKLQLDGT